MIFRSALVGLGVLALSLSTSSARAAVLSLKDTLQYTIENSPNLQNAKKAQDIATLSRKTRQTLFFPSLDLQAIHGLQGSDPTPLASNTASQFSLFLTETLYDNGANWTQYKIAKLQSEKSEVAFKQERDRLTQTTANAFMRYSLLRRILTVQQQQSRLVQSQANLVTKDYESGVRTRKDFIRFKTQARRADIDLVNAKDALEKSKEDLIRIMGVPLNSTEEFEFIADQNEPDLNSLPTAKPILENHYDFKLSELQMRIEERQVDLVDRKYYPEIFLTSGITYQSQDYINTGRSFEDNRNTSWNALITLKYNLWDWGQRNRDRQIANLQKDTQSNNLRRTLLSTRADIENLMLELARLKENYSMGEELLSLEKTSLSILERDYRQGQAQYLDFVAGLNNFASAQINFYTTMYNLRQGLYNYHYHQGDLYEYVMAQP